MYARILTLSLSLSLSLPLLRVYIYIYRVYDLYRRPQQGPPAFPISHHGFRFWYFAGLNLPGLQLPVMGHLELRARSVYLRCCDALSLQALVEVLS